jgi:hypothetical protein
MEAAASLLARWTEENIVPDERDLSGKWPKANF